jgi:hypothetical protein
MEVSGQLHAPAALSPGKEPLVPIGKEAGWAPELFWTRWWRYKFPAPGRESNPRTPIVQPVAQSLHRLNLGESIYDAIRKLNARVWVCILDSSDSGQASLACFYEHGNELSGSIETWNYLWHIKQSLLQSAAILTLHWLMPINCRHIDLWTQTSRKSVLTSVQCQPVRAST